MVGAVCQCDGVVYPDESCDPLPPDCEVVSVDPLEPVYECQCDGSPAEPIGCGCFIDDNGQCSCGGIVYPPETCGEAPPPQCYVWNDGVCKCDGDPSDPDLCDCEITPARECYCGDGLWTTETCCPDGFPC